MTMMNALSSSSRHDDQVDATSGALDVLRTRERDYPLAMPISIECEYWTSMGGGRTPELRVRVEPRWGSPCGARFRLRRGGHARTGEFLEEADITVDDVPARIRLTSIIACAVLAAGESRACAQWRFG